ncbi:MULTISPECIES: IS3 family transposase [Bacillus cereus group]
MWLSSPSTNIYIIYNQQRFQQKLKNLSPHQYKTQVL